MFGIYLLDIPNKQIIGFYKDNHDIIYATKGMFIPLHLNYKYYQPIIISFMQKKWTKETVFEESKKYSSRSEFKRNKSGAFRVAYINGWLDEMVWLVHPVAKPVKWIKEAVFEESKKYSTTNDFNLKNASAYTVARKKGWLEERTWLKRKYVVRGFGQ